MHIRVVFLGALLASRLVLADPAPHESQPDAGAAVLPTMAAIVPGVLVHGAGSYVAGDKAGAKKLLAMEGIGIGLMMVGGIPIAVTGASRSLITPLYATFLSGFGLMGMSFFGNLYGGLSPAFRPGEPLTRLPRLELSLGLQGLQDVRLGNTASAVAEAVGWAGDVRITGESRVALHRDRQRWRLSGAWRLWGPTQEAQELRDGSYFEIELAAQHDRRADEAYSVTGGEVVARGRYDFGRLGPSLAGAFGELHLGSGVHAFDYQDSLDGYAQLLMGAAFGTSFGRRGGFVRGEASIFYDQRKDDEPGAFKTTFIVFGYMGLRTRLYLGERWGLSAELATGGSRLGRLSAVYRFGDLQ